jgi:outer membrane immunogenic protein
MKRIVIALAMALSSAPALAAPPPPIFDWTGFYVGGHIGSAVMHGTLGNLPPSTIFLGPTTPTPAIDFRADGFLGGGQLGYNWQWANWVVGVETDISASHLQSNGPFSISSVVFVSSTMVTGTAELRSDLFTTARGRLGYAAGNLLFFGSGGFAWAREKLNIVGTSASCTFGICGPSSPFASSDARWAGGPAFGGGVDYAFAPNWFVRVEYLRINVGTHNFSVDPNLSGTPLPLSSHFDIVRFALNYRFGH